MIFNAKGAIHKLRCLNFEEKLIKRESSQIFEAKYTFFKKWNSSQTEIMHEPKMNNGSILVEKDTFKIDR